MHGYKSHEINRFRGGVSTEPTSTGCLLWTRSVDGKGYGQIMVAGRLLRTHRVSYEVHHGVSLSPSDVVLHSCDTPRCCNPAHLRVGTQRENMADCRAKGRHAHGETNGHARLTEEQVLAMREEWASAPHRTRWNPEGITMSDIASRYGLTGHTEVASILRGDTWSHVGGPRHTGRDFLSEEQVRAIRAAPLTDSAATVARTLGVSKSAVVSVRSGRSFQHVV